MGYFGPVFKGVGVPAKKKSKKKVASSKRGGRDSSAFAPPPVIEDETPDEEERGYEVGGVEDEESELPPTDAEDEASGAAQREFDRFRLPLTGDVEDDDDDDDMEIGDEDEDEVDDEDEDDGDDEGDTRRGGGGILSMQGQVNGIQEALGVALGNQNISPTNGSRKSVTGAVIYNCYPVKENGLPDNSKKVVLCGEQNRLTIHKQLRLKAPFEHGTWEIHVFRRKIRSDGRTKDKPIDMFHLDTANPDGFVEKRAPGESDPEIDVPVQGLGPSPRLNTFDYGSNDDDEDESMSAIKALVDMQRHAIESQSRMFAEVMQRQASSGFSLAGMIEVLAPLITTLTPLITSIMQGRSSAGGSAEDQLKVIRETMEMGMKLRDTAERPRTMDMLLPICGVAVAALAPNPAVQRMITKLFGMDGDEEQAGEQADAEEQQSLPSPAGRRGIATSRPPTPPPPARNGANGSNGGTRNGSHPAPVIQRPNRNAEIDRIDAKVARGEKLSPSEFRKVSIWSFIDGLIATGNARYGRPGYWATRFATELADDVASAFMQSDDKVLATECLSVGPNIVAFIKAQGTDVSDDEVVNGVVQFIGAMKQQLVREYQAMSEDVADDSAPADPEPIAEGQVNQTD